MNTGHLLSTCKQWSLRFPQLKKNQKIELRIQVFKNAPKGKLNLILAKSKDKIDYITNNLKCFEFSMSEVSEYDEFIAIIDNINDDLNNDMNQWIFCIYRNKEEEISQFKFIIWCQLKFDCCLMKEPDLLNDVCYNINGIFKPGNYVYHVNLQIKKVVGISIFSVILNSR